MPLSLFTTEAPKLAASGTRSFTYQSQNASAMASVPCCCCPLISPSLLSWGVGVIELVQQALYKGLSQADSLLKLHMKRSKRTSLLFSSQLQLPGFRRNLKGKWHLGGKCTPSADVSQKQALVQSPLNRRAQCCDIIYIGLKLALAATQLTGNTSMNRYLPCQLATNVSLLKASVVVNHLDGPPGCRYLFLELVWYLSANFIKVSLIKRKMYFKIQYYTQIINTQPVK